MRLVTSPTRALSWVVMRSCLLDRPSGLSTAFYREHAQEKGRPRKDVRSERRPAMRPASKAGELVDHLGEAPSLVERQIGRGDIEFVVLEPRGFGEVMRQNFAADIKMSDAVLGDRVAAGGGGEEDLGRLGFVLLYALAVE